MLNPTQLRDLEVKIADQIFIQVENWRLYLGDAGLAGELALECSVLSKRYPSCEKVAKEALGNVDVSLGSGKLKVKLIDLIPNEKILDLIEILELNY